MKIWGWASELLLTWIEPNHEGVAVQFHEDARKMPAKLIISSGSASPSAEQISDMQSQNTVKNQCTGIACNTTNQLKVYKVLFILQSCPSFADSVLQFEQ